MREGERDLGKTKSQIRVDVQTPADVSDFLVQIQQQKESEKKSVIADKVHIPLDKIETAIAFWKPIYFSVEKEGRQLNGIEANELGNGKLTDKPDLAPYIAMTNLMALEAMRMMGEYWPTIEDGKMLAFGTEREKEIADFWHKSFAPLAIQAEYAWQACLAVMAGAPEATRRMLEAPEEDLP